ncbi:MAG: PQQ-binding-like beta-propeller repeat protein, partial [Caldisericia bacterium]|nr:PQQ-binding-like beta-propeller repeat protein [Caldisericia bacterium]
MKRILTTFVMLALLVNVSGIGNTKATDNSTDCSSWITLMGGFERSSSSDCKIDPTLGVFREIWRTKIGPTILADQPLIYKDKVVISSFPIVFTDDGYEFTEEDTASLSCLDTNNGDIIWQNTLAGWGSSAIGSIDTYRKNIIVGATGANPSSENPEDWMESYIYGVDLNTGATTWTHDIHYGIRASGVIEDGEYFVGTNDRSKFICLNADTGKEIWNMDSPNNHGSSSPCLLDNSLYSYSYSGVLTAFSCEGTKGWSEKLGNSRVRDITPSVWDNKLVVPTTDGTVILFNPNGTKKWTCYLESEPLDNNDTISSTAVYEDNIYVISKVLEVAGKGRFSYGPANLYCIDAKKGKVKEKVSLDGHGTGSIVVANGFVFYVVSVNRIDVFHADTLEPLNPIGVEDGFVSTSLSVYDDKLFFGLHTGEMVCYGISPFIPLKLDYGECYLETEKEETIRIENIYDESMDYSVSTSSDWFKIADNKKGSLESGESVKITIKTIPNKISRVDSTYKGTLTVRLGGEFLKIPIKLKTKYPSKIYISPDPALCEIGTELEFIARPMGEDGERLTGYNFRWEISNPTIGEIDDEGHFYGKKIGTTEIRAFVMPAPKNSPIYGKSNVEVIELKAPIIPTLLNFGKIKLNEVNDMELVITNESSKTLNVSFIPYENWFKLDKTSLKIEGGEKATVVITINNSHFKPGEKKTGDIKVGWSGGTQRVTVVAKADKDSEPPTISIDNSFEKATDLSEVMLSGSTNEKCEIFINGEVIAEDDDSFEFVFKLKKAPSRNSVVITATDSAGNTSTMEFEIINNHMLTIKTSIDNKILYTDGVPVELDVAPTIVSGRTLAPFR